MARDIITTLRRVGATALWLEQEDGWLLLVDDISQPLDPALGAVWITYRGEIAEVRIVGDPLRYITDDTAAELVLRLTPPR